MSKLNRRCQVILQVLRHTSRYASCLSICYLSRSSQPRSCRRPPAPSPNESCSVPGRLSAIRGSLSRWRLNATEFSASSIPGGMTALKFRVVSGNSKPANSRSLTLQVRRRYSLWKAKASVSYSRASIGAVQVLFVRSRRSGSHVRPEA